MEIPKAVAKYVPISSEYQSISVTRSGRRYGLIAVPAVIYDNHCLPQKTQIQFDDAVSVNKETVLSSCSTYIFPHNVMKGRSNCYKLVTKLAEHNLIKSTDTACDQYEQNIYKSADIEMHCGIPFLLQSGKQNPRNEHIKRANNSSIHNDISIMCGLNVTPSLHTKQTFPLNAQIRNKEKSILASPGKNIMNPIVLLTDVKLHSQETVSSPKRLIVFKNVPEETTTGSDREHGKSLHCNEDFVRPVDLPPRNKVRIAPMLGSKATANSVACNKPINKDHHTLNFQSGTCNKLNGKDARDIHTECEKSMVKESMKSKGDKNDSQYIGSSIIIRKSTSVIKSQNDVRKIDKQIPGPENNAADKWTTHPATPKYQQTIPLRPAFSDCGMRRHVTDSPSGVTFQCQKRWSADDSGIDKSLDDSGVETIAEMKCYSLPSSPADSNIEGFRSSSDVSDEEDPCPNINGAVLRRSKVATYTASEHCPGCTTSQDITGPLLNSKTFNIILKNDTNTCAVHRKVQQTEQLHISKTKKMKKQPLKTKRKPQPSSKPKHKSSTYDYLSELTKAAAESKDVASSRHCAKTTKGRNSKPFSVCEEKSLRQGVKRYGHDWKMILQSFKFAKGRTTIGLRHTWQRMVKRNARREKI